MKKHKYNININSNLSEDDLDFNIDLNIGTPIIKQETIIKINTYERKNTRVCKHTIPRRNLF